MLIAQAIRKQPAHGRDIRCKQTEPRDVIMVGTMIKFHCGNAFAAASFPYREAEYPVASCAAVNPGMPRACLGRRAAAMEDCIWEIPGT